VKKKPPLVRGTEFSDDHRVHLLQGAEELFPALTEAMDAALSDIQFETYIFDFTGSGAAVAEALMRAAQRGGHQHRATAQQQPAAETTAVMAAPLRVRLLACRV